MKKFDCFVAILAVLLSLLCMLTDASGAVDISNPSFEDVETEVDNPYGDLAAGWGRWGHWMNRETGWKPTVSGKCVMGYHHWEISGSDTSGIFQDVEDIEPESTCTFSVHVAKDSGTNAESVELRLEKLGGFETLASMTYSMQDIKGSYSKLSVTGRNKEQGVRLVVVVTPSQSDDREGALKFDDVSLDVE